MPVSDATLMKTRQPLISPWRVVVSTPGRVCLLLMALAVFVTPGVARASMADKPAHGPVERGIVAAQAAARFQVWVQGVRREAAAQGISSATLRRALGSVRRINRVVQLDRRQPEFTQTFWHYLDQRVTLVRIARGRQLLHQHHVLLAAVQRRYGVPARYLVAFWALETNFGDHVGTFPVIDALATLAYDQRRSQFFRTQLIDALHIINAGHITARAMKGSWAGAMGQLQFIPSTFLHYAVDGDGDGRRDLWGDLADVFASGANYLRHEGWQRGQRWGRAVRLPRTFDWNLAQLDIRQPLKTWAALGVRRTDGGPLPQDNMKASLVLPQGHAGPAFLVYHNFRVILHWNRSLNYALAVGILADRLVGVPALELGRKADSRVLSRTQSLELQRLLVTMGYAAGRPDGILGAKTRAAVRTYQVAAGLPADGYPSPGVLAHLRRAEAARHR